MSLIIKDSFMLFVLLILLNLSSCENMINDDVYPLDFYTQYRQFYLTDGADEDPDENLWT